MMLRTLINLLHFTIAAFAIPRHGRDALVSSDRPGVRPSTMLAESDNSGFNGEGFQALSDLEDSASGNGQ